MTTEALKHLEADCLLRTNHTALLQSVFEQGRATPASDRVQPSFDDLQKLSHIPGVGDHDRDVYSAYLAHALDHNGAYEQRRRRFRGAGDGGILAPQYA